MKTSQVASGTPAGVQLAAVPQAPPVAPVKALAVRGAISSKRAVSDQLRVPGTTAVCEKVTPSGTSAPSQRTKR